MAKPEHPFTVIHPDDNQLDQDSQLSAVLAAWHCATERLQQTHETLRKEVKRLTAELAVKNRELLRKNRLADLGQMASHVAHEVRNSLVPMTLYLSLLKRRMDRDSDDMDIVNKIQAGLVALEATVNDLLNFTMNREPQYSQFDIDVLLGEIVNDLRPQLAAQSIQTTIDVLGGGPSLNADREMVRRGVLNLVLNAIDAMPHGGELVITVVKSDEGFDLEIADSGPGLDEEQFQRAFEPFFTTKSTGTGLGLSIVYQIAEAHGGVVTIRNCPEGGAAFTIHLPNRAMAWKAAA